MIVSKGKNLAVHLPERASAERDVTGNLEELERRHIMAVLEKTDWRIGGQGGRRRDSRSEKNDSPFENEKISLKQSNKALSI